MASASHYDVVVIGGGHNGLISAGLLAKRGFKVLVLERRPVTGGAAITEQPWGPDFKMTALSYVVSMMPQVVLDELQLQKFGYKIYPQHGYFVPHRDGRFLQMPHDKQRRHEQISKFSTKDANAIERWDTWLKGLAQLLGPLLSVIPPRVGSKSLRDVLNTLKFGWRLKSLDMQQVGDVTKLMTSSISDVLDEYFESPQLKGVLSVSGIIGTWAGPRSPGTAYVMAHHQIGDVGLGRMEAWGFPEGGMGGVTTAIRASIEALGVTVQTDAPVAKITVKHGRACGVVLENGNEFTCEQVIATTHPQRTFLEFLDRTTLPPAFVNSIEHWKTRSGTVKVNLALDRLPEFTAKPGFDPEVHGGTIVLADSLDDLEGAFQDAVNGQASRVPFADICIPSVFDKTLAPEGKHVMSMFTQWVPHTWSKQQPAAELDAYVNRLIARMDEVAPGFSSSILHKQVIGPYEMEHTYGLLGGNIFHGELSAGQLFHMRPAPGYANYRTPVKGLYFASSGTHGGGGVTGIPAVQAVTQLMADR